ncbi:hypothetical protein [Umboniibacter marinipuniceus]|uniref:Uncharacterized protein n=1 Tax=Umboniibacter marinipuniceus TaxID=569599 RepID=A0A3M0AGL4_9GAMM|nr:hypothetical protein [Umboniibacter marinipuniceus]RMA82699.1 hypothetical protein DFR27_0656 [Umboniibacter marinipuniceus]
MTCLTKTLPQTKQLIATEIKAAFGNGVNIEAANDATNLLYALGVTLPRNGERVSLHATAQHLGITIQRHWNGASREAITKVKEALPLCDESCTCAVEAYRIELECELRKTAKKNKRVKELMVTRDASKRQYFVHVLVDIADSEPEWTKWAQSGKKDSIRRIKKLGNQKSPRGQHLTTAYFAEIEREANERLSKVDPWGVFSIQSIRPHDSSKGRSQFMANYKQMEYFPLQLMFLNTPEAITSMNTLRSTKLSENSILKMIQCRTLQLRLRLSLRAKELTPGNFVYSVRGKEKKCLTLTDVSQNLELKVYPSNDEVGVPSLRNIDQFAHVTSSEYVVYAYAFRYVLSENFNVPLIKFGYTKIDWREDDSRDYLKRIIQQRGSYLDQLSGDTKDVVLIGYQVCDNALAAKNLEQRIKRETEPFDFQRFAPEEFVGRVRKGSELRSTKARGTVLKLLSDDKTSHAA